MILISCIILESRMSATERQIDEAHWRIFSHNRLFMECNSYKKWQTISTINSLSVGKKKGGGVDRVSPPHIYISMAADGVAMGGGSAVWRMMGNGRNFSVQTKTELFLCSLTSPLTQAFPIFHSGMKLLLFKREIGIHAGLYLHLLFLLSLPPSLSPPPPPAAPVYAFVHHYMVLVSKRRCLIRLGWTLPVCFCILLFFVLFFTSFSFHWRLRCCEHGINQFILIC